MKIFIFLHFPHFFFIVVCNSLCMPWWAKNTFRFKKKNYSVFNLRNSLEREREKQQQQQKKNYTCKRNSFLYIFCSSSPLFIMIYFAITQMLSTFVLLQLLLYALHTLTALWVTQIALRDARIEIELENGCKLHTLNLIMCLHVSSLLSASY